MEQQVDVHLKSDFYDVEGFLKGESSLNDIELGLLGDIKGKSILHLQCHFGQDTISLGRLAQMLQVLIYPIKRLTMQRY